MAKGIVVQNKESGIRYAVHEDAWDKATEKKVRDLKPGESVFSYIPKLAPDQGEETDAGDDSATAGTTSAGATTPDSTTKK